MNKIKKVITRSFWKGFSKIIQICYIYENEKIVYTFENGKILERHRKKLKLHETNRT